MTAESFAVERFRFGPNRLDADHVAVEEPLEIRLAFSTPDGRAVRSIAITMRTPGDDEALAAGFLLSESIIQRRQDIVSIEACGRPADGQLRSNVIRVELQRDVAVDLKALQRHFYTTSSCGVCGKSSLEALHVSGARPMVLAEPLFSGTMLTSLPAQLRARQNTFDQTGGLHAAAAFDVNGTIVELFEDVGRHNAVDKLVGRLLLDDKLPASELGLLVSGRTSFELAQKCVMAGIPLLAAISAPSSLAVSLAKEFGLTLVGFLRGEEFNVYAARERITA